MNRIGIITVLTVAGAGVCLADFSYEQTSKITGGAMMSMMKVASVFSKQLREPMRSTILVKGNRMAQLTGNTGHLIDLDKETMTEINFEKRTYSVVTFAQLAQAMKEAEAKLRKDKSEGGEVTFNASFKETGQTKQIGGVNAKEVVLLLEMLGKDPDTGKEGTVMKVTADMWLAPQVAGYNEVKDFYRRMSEKMAWVPGGNMMTMGRPDVTRGMAGVYREAAKIDGVPVLQISKIGMAAAPGTEGQQAAAPAQEQPQPAPQAQPEEKPSIGGALKGLGGGRFGGLGGFGRKKKNQEAEAQPAPQQAQSQPAAQPQQAQAEPGVLMELTTELAGFSSAPVDGSKLEVPAGFKQVDSETLKAMKR